MNEPQRDAVGAVVAKCWWGYTEREPHGLTEEAVQRAVNMIRADKEGTDEMVATAITVMCYLSSEAGGVLGTEADQDEHREWMNHLLILHRVKE